MAKLKLIETIQTKLSTLSKTDGQLIVIRDNASLYIDLDGNRIYISDWLDIATDTDRLAMLTPLSNKYYYVVETNKIWRYISGSWVLVTQDNFVDANRTIAGIDLNDDITVDELVSALGIDNKVDKVDGMGLSSNDYSDEEKETVATNKADIAELKSLQDITNTTDTTLYGSYDGIVSINEIYGNTEQDSTEGKNLFKNNAANATDNGITMTVNNDGSVTLKGTSTARATFSLGSVKLTAGTYTLSQSYVSSGNSACIIGTYAKSDGTASYLDLFNNSLGSKTFTLTEDTTVNVKADVRNADMTISNVTLYPMLEKGEVATEWEPYTAGASPNTQYEQPVRKVVLNVIKTCGKNILKNTATAETKYGVTFTKDSDGKIFVNGTATANMNYYICQKLKLQGNKQYKIRGCTGGSTTTYMLAVRNSDDTSNVVNYNSSKSFITQSDGIITVYIRIISGTVCNNLVFEPMIVDYSETDLTYKPYTESVVTLSEPITLNGIDDVRDNLDGKKYKEVVFDGSETWRASSSVTGRYIVAISDVKLGSKALCTQAKNGYNNTQVVNEFYVSGSSAEFVINTSFATLAEWKAHLASKPMKVTYELAEPIETPLPEADVEALKSLKTYDGVTHIFTDSEVEPDLNMDYGTSKVGAVALQACAEGCIALNRTSDYVEMTDSDIEAIYNEVF